VINDKSQGSITKHLRCDLLLYANLPLSLLVKEFLKLVNMLQSHGQNGRSFYVPRAVERGWSGG